MTPSEQNKKGLFLGKNKKAKNKKVSSGLLMAYVRVESVSHFWYTGHMESITIRKFRANLKRYLDAMKAGDTIVVDGWEYAKIGKIGPTWGEKVKKRAAVREESVAKKEEIIEEEEDDWPENDDGIKREACQLCGCVGDWVFWEDGEERVVCDPCIRKRCSGEKMYKMMVRGYNKIV